MGQHGRVLYGRISTFMVSNSNGIGLKVYFHRTSYKDTATEELMGFYWMASFAADGRLLAISAETKYTIDLPETAS